MLRRLCRGLAQVTAWVNAVAPKADCGRRMLLSRRKIPSAILTAAMALTDRREARYGIWRVVFRLLQRKILTSMLSIRFANFKNLKFLAD